MEDNKIKAMINDNIFGVIRGRMFQYSGMIGDTLSFTNGYSNFYIPVASKEVSVDDKHTYIIHKATSEYILLELK